MKKIDLQAEKVYNDEEITYRKKKDYGKYGK
jgi:hypothetical protein